MKIAGIVSGVIGSFMLFFCIGVDNSGDRLFCGLMALITLSISVMCFHYKCEVIIDPETQTVKKSIFTKIWNKTATYPFSDFNKVQILSGGGGNTQIAEVIYIVHLEGASKICIPGTCDYLDQAIEKGKTIASTLKLPLIEKPQMGFVLDIFERLT